MGYDNPNATITREHCLGLITGVASAQMAKFRMFQKQKLLEVVATVQTAGTNTVAGFDIYVGTTSVGAVTVGTNAAGVSVSSGAINAEVADDTAIELRGKATSATMVLGVTMATKAYHDAAAVP